MLSFIRFILIHNSWVVKISYFKCFIYFIQKQVEAFTVHLRFYFLKANLQVIPVIRLQCRVKVSPFHGVSVYWEAQVLIEVFAILFAIQIPVKKLIFPPKNLEKIRMHQFAIENFKLCKLHPFKMIQFSRQKT